MKKFNASRTVQRAETRIGEPNERERLESPFTSCRSRCARNNEYQAAKRCDQLKQALDNATRESEHNYGNLQTDLETSKSENTMLRKLCDDLKQELEKLQRESEQNCNSLQADLEASERENGEWNE